MRTRSIHQMWHLRPGVVARMGVFLVLALAAGPLRGQERSPASYEAEVLFLDGVGLYDSLRFKEASTAFDVMLKLFPGSHRTTAASIMRAKALYHMGENVESAKALQNFLTMYDSSAYCADAHLTLGLIYRRLGRPTDALHELVQARRQVPPSRPARLVQAISLVLDSLTLFDLTSRDIHLYLLRALPPECAVYLRTKLVERAWRQGDAGAARLALDTLAAMLPASDTGSVVGLWRYRLSQPQHLQLAALLPRLGEGSQRGVENEVYEGIVYAVEEFARDSSSGLRVLLTTRDSDRDSSDLVRTVRELAADSTVVGIVGPVYSAAAFIAARAARDAGVPLVTPTATANGISAVGTHVFQANPDYDIRGRAMAKYAVNKLGFRELGVLAPSNSHGRFMAEGFLTEAARLGAHVVATQWYESGSADLQAQLTAVRRAAAVDRTDPYLSFAVKRKRPELQKLVALGIPMTRIDSLTQKGAVVKAVSLLGPRAKAQLDSAGITMIYREARTDSIEIPVENIQAMYLPITSPQEIGVVSSQLVYFNIHSQFLGSGEWNSFTDLDANKRYCSGMMFESDSYVDTASAAYKQMVGGFATRFRKAPSKYALFGYDAAALCLAMVREGGNTREALRERLAQVREFSGVHAKLGFTSGRVNSWIGIMQFDGTGIRRVDEIQVE